jgi:hypothetical protein
MTALLAEPGLDGFDLKLGRPEDLRFADGEFRASANARLLGRELLCDFTLRMEFQGSGAAVELHDREGNGARHVRFQPAADGRRFLSGPSPAGWRAIDVGPVALKADGWNTMELIRRGKAVTVVINGAKVLDPGAAAHRHPGQETLDGLVRLAFELGPQTRLRTVALRRE